MRRLVLGEHRSPARRASWRAYYVRDAPRIRKTARDWYWKNHEHCLAMKRARRLRQHRIKWPLTPLSEQGWVDIRRHYETVRAMGESMTFKQLGAWFLVSPKRLQRRSSREGGWALRFTPETRA
jgi:hypothetical protein